jgi:hypothetical protein
MMDGIENDSRDYTQADMARIHGRYMRLPARSGAGGATARTRAFDVGHRWETAHTPERVACRLPLPGDLFEAETPAVLKRAA